MCQHSAERRAVFSVGTGCIVSVPSTAGAGVKMRQLNNMSCAAGMYMHTARTYGHTFFFRVVSRRIS